MRIITKGATDQSVQLYVVDNTTGLPATGLAYNSSGIDLWYRRAGAALTSITEATQTVSGAHSDGGFVHIANGNYRLDLPDAAVASGVDEVTVGGTITGYTVYPAIIQLTSVNLQDAVRGGLTALPNANAEASGGLYTRGTGAGQINQANNGQIDANAARTGGTTNTGRDIGASVLLSSGTGTGQLSITSGIAAVNVTQIGGDLTAATNAKTQFTSAPALPADFTSLAGYWVAGVGMYDATSSGNLISASGGLVARWEDQSGNAKHLTQSTSGSRPAYDPKRNLICFQEGDNDYLTVSHSGNRNSFTVVVFGEIPSLRRHWTGSGFSGAGGADYVASMHPVVYLSYNGGDTLTGLGTPGAMSIYDGVGGGSASYSNSTLKLPTRMTMFGVSGGSTYKFFVNDRMTLGKSSTSGSITDFSLGHSAASSGAHQNVKAVMLFTGELTDAQRAYLYQFGQKHFGVVDPTKKSVNLVIEGDSLSTGVRGTLNNSWCNLLAAQYPEISFYNNAEPGQLQTDIATNAAARVDTLLNPNARNVHGNFSGTNDLAGGATGATTASNNSSYRTARKSAGWDRYFTFTMLPRGAATETHRGNLNTALRAQYTITSEIGPNIFENSDGDILIDVAADTRIGDSGDYADTTYYDADEIHLNDAGHAVVAEIAAPVFRYLLNTTMTAVDSDRLRDLETGGAATPEDIADAVRTELTTELGRIDVAVSTRLAPTTASRTLDVTATGAAGIDWGNVENPTTTVNFSGSTVKTATDIATLIGSTGSGLTSLATASALSTVSGKIDTVDDFLDTEIAAIKAKTDTIPASPAAVGSAMTLADDAITAAKYDESTAFPLKAADSGSTYIGRTGADGDTLKSLSDEVSAISTGSNPNVLLESEIASVTNQTTIVLNDGATFNDAYNGQAIVLYDNSNSDYPSVRVVSDYVGSTKTITLDSAPDFTVAADDSVRLFATAPGTSAPTAATVASAVRTELNTELGRIDVASSTLATAANLSTLAGYVDTEVAAIKTKTDFLPSATAGSTGGVLIAGSNAGTTFATLTSTGAMSINGTGNVAQTGDSFARIGSNGASLSAIPWNASWDAEVQSECQDALVANNLDHLAAASVTGSDVVDNSIIAKLVSKSGTADWDTFVNTTDSLEAIKDSGGGEVSLTPEDIEAIGEAAASGIDNGAIADAVLDEALSGHTTSGTLGERLSRIPNAAAGGNGGLPTVNASNYIAGVAGTINTLDALDTAQDSQHSTTQGRLPASLVSGRMDASVGAMASNVFTAAAVNADAVTEIQSGLATSSALSTVSGKIDVADENIDKMLTAYELDGSVYRLTTNAVEQVVTGTVELDEETIDQIVDSVADALVPTDYDEVQTRVTAAITAYDPPTKAELDSAVSPLATSSALSTVNSNLNTVDSNVDAILATTSALPSFPVNFAALGINASGHISRTTLTDTVTTYTGNTPQTGDAFARLGSPAGASIAADIATRASASSVDEIPTNSELATALDPLPTAAENRAEMDSNSVKLGAINTRVLLGVPNAAPGASTGVARVTDLPEGGEGGVVIPVNQVVVPPSRTWLLVDTTDGLKDETPRTMRLGETKLFAIDFRNDLPTNGRLEDVAAVTISEGTADGVTFADDDGIDPGVDKSQAKVSISAAVPGTYEIEVEADYQEASGGGGAKGVVTLIVTE